MADDKRNFRSYYYEKFGVRGVEEKKSIEILLNDKPIDLDKLSQFCSKFPVPSMHRPLVWKVLLGVLPPYHSIHDFVWKQRQEQYDDLINALNVMQRITDNTPKPEVFLKMFLLEDGKLKLEEDTEFSDENNQNFFVLAITFVKLFQTDIDVYWLSRNFSKCIAKHKDTFNSLVDNISFLLQKDDLELYNHLQTIAALQILPVKTWFSRCYAGILHDSSLVKIWDKVIGGSFKILPYVAIAILTTCRRTILSCSSAQEVNRYLVGLSEETSEIVVNQAIETWKKHGETGRKN